MRMSEKCHNNNNNNNSHNPLTSRRTDGGKKIHDTSQPPTLKTGLLYLRMLARSLDWSFRPVDKNRLGWQLPRTERKHSTNAGPESCMRETQLFGL